MKRRDANSCLGLIKGEFPREPGKSPVSLEWERWKLR